MVGASATGKTEVARSLRKLFSIQRAVTNTTRSPRVGETNHVDYHFMSKEEFLVEESNNNLVESTFYNGNYYGCSKSEVRDDKCVILDPSGVKSFLALNDSHVIVFALTAKESTRAARMAERGDSIEAIASRLANDVSTFSEENIGRIDFRIETDELTPDQIAEKIYSAYTEELKKR